MSTPQQHATRPEDRVPFPRRLAYGAGAFANNLLGAAPGEMMIVLNLGLGMNPVLIGLITSIPRIIDAITDPLMGFISDGTRSRWGRRRPYIFAGAILVALIFAAMWQVNPAWSENFTFVWFLLFTIFFYIAYTMMATPWVALGYELTPDYNERTRLMGTQYIAGSIVYLFTPWFLYIINSGKFFRDAAGNPDQIIGAKGLAITIAVVVIALGILPAIFLRERTYQEKEQPEASATPGPGFQTRMVEFFQGFGATLKSGPFLKLCAATFLVFNGYQLIASFQKYVIIYYMFGGDQEVGAKWNGIAGSISQGSAFVAVILVTMLATRIGKRQTFMLATGVSALGYALKWVFYIPGHPMLVAVPAVLIGFSLSSLFTLMPSMTADVVDLDELKTNQRREGMYGAIYWFMVKLGISAAGLGSGYLLNATGFQVELGPIQAPSTLTLMRICDAGIPALTSLLAIWAVSRFPLTEEKSREIRHQLEDRRGKARLQEGA